MIRVPHFVHILTGPGAHTASCSIGTLVLSQGGKAVGAWCWPLTSGTEVKSDWSCTSTVPLRLHGMNRDNFTFNCFVHAGSCHIWSPVLRVITCQLYGEELLKKTECCMLSSGWFTGICSLNAKLMFCWPLTNRPVPLQSWCSQLT
jgi:hypothetical protein